jgi:MFS family permease
MASRVFHFMNPHQSNLIQNLRALPRPVWILFAGTFINRFGSFVIPFLAIYVRQRGFTEAEAGIALAAYGAGHLVASPFGGYLADRIGRRKTISISMFSSAVTMLLLSQANSLPEIAVLTAFTGLATELYRPASSALLTDLVPENARVTAFAAYRLALNAGFAFGPATAGFLIKHSFLWLFVGDAITSIGFGIVAWLALPHGVRASSQTAKWSEALKRMRGDRRLHKLALGQFAVALVFFQMVSTFGIHVTSLGFAPSTYGALISMNGVLIVGFELWITSFTRRFPASHVIALGYVLTGVGFALNGFAHALPMLVLVMIILTLGEMISMPVAAAYFAEGIPPEMRGRYMGVSALSWALGLTIGPSLGLKLHAENPNWLWGGAAAIGLLAAALVLRAGKTPSETPQPMIQPQRL